LEGNNMAAPGMVEYIMVDGIEYRRVHTGAGFANDALVTAEDRATDEYKAAHAASAKGADYGDGFVEGFKAGAEVESK
jgi:hypothetical protein